MTKKNQQTAIKKKKMNLPNRLSLMRVALIPIFVIFIFLEQLKNDNLFRILAIVIFILASATDFLDGYIARKHSLITNFGKFIDPLADKVLVIAAFIGVLILEFNNSEFMMFALIAASTILVIFREMAVTSLRLAAADKKVIAAAKLGKIKTVTQMLFVIIALTEPIFGYEIRFATYFSMGAMIMMTIWSGIDYFIAYLPYLETNE